MLKTCFNCKLPGSQCPTRGGARYSCNAVQQEISWNDVYKKEDKKKEEEGAILDEKICNADHVNFEEIETPSD